MNIETVTSRIGLLDELNKKRKQLIFISKTLITDGN